jgi:hypothetical protein
MNRLTVQEAADRFEIAVSILHQAIRDGKLKVKMEQRLNRRPVRTLQYTRTLAYVRKVRRHQDKKTSNDYATVSMTKAQKAKLEQLRVEFATRTTQPRKPTLGEFVLDAAKHLVSSV